MSSEIISFNCKVCHSGLTVPANMAGVTGPCPICGVEITAPVPKSPDLEPPFVWPTFDTEQTAPAAKDILPAPEGPPVAASVEVPLPNASWPSPSPAAEQGGGNPARKASNFPGEFLLGGKQEGWQTAAPGNTVSPLSMSPWLNMSGGTANPPSGFGSVSKLSETLGNQDLEPVTSRGRDLWTTLLPVLVAIGVISGAFYYFFVIIPNQGLARNSSSGPKETASKNARSANSPGLNPLENREGLPSMPAADAFPNGNPLPAIENPSPSSPDALPGPPVINPSAQETIPNNNPVVPAPPGIEKVPPLTPSAGGAGADAAIPDSKIVAVSVPTRDSLPQPVMSVEVTPEARQAADTLVDFLNAPTWKERIAYTSNSPKLKAIMEKYYQQNPDGKARARSVVFYGDRVILEENQNLKIFIVEIEGIAGGIPVAVEKNKDGRHTVSWTSFAQFKDRVLDKFAGNPRSHLRGQFCATLKRSHYFGNGTPKFKKDNLLAFSISTPIKNSPSYDVVLDRKSELGQQLVSMIQYGIELPVTVDLEWITDDGDPYLQLASMPMPGWRDE